MEEKGEVGSGREKRTPERSPSSKFATTPLLLLLFDNKLIASTQSKSVIEEWITVKYNILEYINEITLWRAGLILRWVTVRGYTSHSRRLGLAIRPQAGAVSISDGHDHTSEELTVSN